MTITIGLAGKGSAGKSTLVPHLLHHIHQFHPTLRLLVVDADPHLSATTLLGVTAPTTLGLLRTQYEQVFARGTVLRDETREAFAERVMGDEALMHLPTCDLLAMGHWALPGSQCTVNRVLERAVRNLLDDYDLVLFDNEAGIEHMGRYASIPLDLLLLVTTPEPLFFDVARCILDRSAEVQRRIDRRWLVVNRMQAEDVADVQLWADIRALAGVEIGAFLPESPALRSLSRMRQSPLQLAPSDPWALAVADLATRVAKWMPTHRSATSAALVARLQRLDTVKP